MKISEVLKLEEANECCVILHKEGLFWRAYERSAYRFVKQIKQFQITKKAIKSVKQDIVYCGFPQNSLIGILKLVKNKEVKQDIKQINISSFDIRNEDYEMWKADISIVTKANMEQKTNASVDLFENSILNKIRNFQVISKSPIECQQFLIEIQNQINGTTLRTTNI